MRGLAPTAVAAVLLTTTAVLAQDFPQTFEHRYGTTVIESAPERVVSLSYQNHDNLLALGVVPVGLRFWYGDYPHGVWPWGQEALGDADPFVIRGDLNIEAIAALDPDVIEAIWSGVSQEEYDLLSEIAPVVAAEAQYDDFGTPWDVIALTTGRIVGREAEAQAQVDAIRARLADAAAAHPDWQGASAVVAYAWEPAHPGAYSGTDIRVTLLSDLGFVTPQAILDASPEGEFYADLSAEDLAPLDADLLVWVTDTPTPDNILGLSLRTQLGAHVEGREVYADPLLTSAFSHASLLSLPFALDRLLPQIEAAVDGDPATPVPEAVASGIAP